MLIQFKFTESCNTILSIFCLKCLLSFLLKYHEQLWTVKIFFSLNQDISGSLSLKKIPHSRGARTRLGDWTGHWYNHHKLFEFQLGILLESSCEKSFNILNQKASIYKSFPCNVLLASSVSYEGNKLKQKDLHNVIKKMRAFIFYVC